MNQDRNFLKRHALPIGVILMFLFTWPLDLSNSGVLPFRAPFIIYLFLGWGFVLASVLMTGLTQGRQAVATLLKRYLIWRVGWKWYLAPLIVPAVTVLGLALYSMFSGTTLDFSAIYAYKIFGPSANLLLFIIPFFVTDFISNGEEIGWRGYVLPRLQTKYGALAAALIIGVIWGLWHLPKFVMHWNTAVFVLFILENVAKSVMMAWIYNNTRGSLLMVTLTHAAYNTAGVFLPIANTLSDANSGSRLLITALLLAVAAVVALGVDPARFTRREHSAVEVSQ